MCHQLSKEGIDVETHTQSSIYISTIKVAMKIATCTLMVNKLIAKIYILILKNEWSKANLEALDLPNGMTNIVVNWKIAVLDQYHIFKEDHQDDCCGHYQCEHWK